MGGSWERLAHVELSSAGDLDSGTFTAKENLKVTINSLGNGAVNNRMRFNGSSSSDYTFRVSGNGGSGSSSTSQTGIPIGNGNTQSPDNAFDVVNITNIASKEKLVIGHTITDEGTGSGNAPQRNEVVGKWTNTSAQITRIQLVNTGSGNFSAGSYMTVWGASDDVANDTTQNSTIFEENDTGKHYIWNATSDSWTEIS